MSSFNTGTIVLRGGAGDELGLLMRRGLIIVKGDCGEFACASMIAGTVVLLGKAGERLGAGMKRGTIIVASEPRLPPSFRHACEYHPSFLSLLRNRLSHFAIELPDATMSCYRGDLLSGGRGEVFSTKFKRM